MLVADFAILVAVAIVETGLAHAALHCAHSPTASSRLNQMATNARSRRNRGISCNDWPRFSATSSRIKSRAMSSDNRIGFVELVPWHDRRIRLAVIQRSHHCGAVRTKRARAAGFPRRLKRCVAMWCDALRRVAERCDAPRRVALPTVMSISPTRLIDHPNMVQSQVDFKTALLS